MNFNHLWITQGINKDTITFMEEHGRKLCDISDKNNTVGKNALTTSQIRNIYAEIKRIEAKGYENSKTEFLLLKPKLAYNVARVTRNSQDNKIKDFQQVFNQAYEAVKNAEDFNRFVQLMEGIIAYHKVYGGKD